MRRTLLKIIAASLGAIIVSPYKFIYAETKKIINQNLTEEQKEILFNEGTERPFTSALLHEKRKGFYHCANCGNKLFSSEAKYDSGQDGLLFQRHYQEHLKLKLISLLE